MNLAILGSPVGHSLSPAMHRAALAAVGLGGGYLARDVDVLGFREGVADIRTGALDGANVTMPHKVAAYQLCDEVSADAERAGAVNTLSMNGEFLRGDNTDVLGIRSAWSLRALPDTGPVIILGAGGAAAAAQVALSGRELYITARREETARQLAARVGAGATAIGWGEPLPPGVIVNATSLGMHGESLPEYLLESCLGLLDMTYGDNPTPSVAAVKRAGTPVADGLDMLVGQAVGSFAIWTGTEVDAGVFRSAAEQELASRRN